LHRTPSPLRPTPPSGRSCPAFMRLRRRPLPDGGAPARRAGRGAVP